MFSLEKKTALQSCIGSAIPDLAGDRRFWQPAWPSCAIPNQIRDRVMLLQSIGRNQGLDYVFFGKNSFTIMYR